MEDVPEPKDYSVEDALNARRLLVLLECEGHFHQLELTAEQFKAVSDAVVCRSHTSLPLPVPERPELTESTVHLHEDWRIDADLFLGLDDFYPTKCDGSRGTIGDHDDV